LNNCSRIDGNSISGKIPSFIKNWQSVNRMLVHSDIKHLMTFNWSESERPSFTQVSISTVSSFSRDMQGTSMSGPIPPEISLLKNLTELYETFHMLHYGFITFFILYWSLVLKMDCDWPKVMHHQEGDWFEWTKHEISSLTKCTAPYGSVSLCFCDFNQATL
jgi:hypothetical protein